MTEKKTERTPLAADAITGAATLFAPAAGDVAARVQWTLDAMSSTGSTATQIAGDVDAYYQTQGKRNPRGFGRASIVNSASTGDLWGRTGCGMTKVKDSTEPGGYATHVTLIDALDSARNAHGKKTVQKLIDATAETLQTEVTATNRYRAMLDAVRALIDAPTEETQKKDTVPTFATFVKRAASLREYGNALSDEAWAEGVAGLSADDRETLDALRALIGNALKK